MLWVKGYETCLEKRKKKITEYIVWSVCLRNLEYRSVRKEPLKSPHRSSPLPSDCMATLLSAMENWRYMVCFIFDNYAVNSACQHCGFFPIFLVALRCVNKVTKELKIISLYWYGTYVKSHVLWHSYEMILSMLIFMLLLFNIFAFCFVLL